ncbi:MAG: hypothetical protein CMN28_14425 [Salinisphaeraceae bacterium]|nr:hypothetical protein [Salinisphaeraceae bacterium]
MTSKLGTFGLAAALAATPAISSAGIFKELWDSTVFQGILRTDVAIRTSNTQNFYNQGNQPYSDTEITRQAYFPPAFTDPGTIVPGGVVDPGALAALTGAIAGITGQDPGTPSPGYWTTPIPGVMDQFRRSDSVPRPDDDLNYLQFRLEGTMTTRFTRNWKLDVRMRALYDPGWYDEFETDSVNDIAGGFTGGQAPDYDVNYFEAKGRDGDKNLNPLEIAGEHYMIDLPTFQVEYKSGDLTLRMGNQTIAWGSSIFFRTLDIPNGLDFRRHLILDRAIEEFSDKRVPALSVRATYQLTNNILGDFFVKKFQPSILPNPNTPYNVIPTGFNKPFDNYYEGGYDTELDAGFRIKADYGTWGWQAVYAHRYNPLGVIRWTKSGVNKGLYGPVGEIVTAAYEAKLSPSEPGYDALCGGDNYSPTTCALYDTIDEAFANAPIAAGPTGAATSQDWFAVAGGVRVNGFEALNNAILDFPAMQDIYGAEAFNLEQARNELDTFFQGGGPMGGLRGNIERDYEREDVFGLGGSYVTSSENTWLDSIILNLEVQYTPDRVFTDPGLSKDYLTADETIASFVAEKWTRWSAAYPAAYLVFQYQYRSESDLVGLHLSGYSGNDEDGSDPTIPDGIGSSNYFVFAGFQPTPNRRFVIEWAALYDIKGGLLIQPGLQYNPGGGKVVEVLYNYVDGDLHGEPTENVVRRIDFADELVFRFTYQF